MKFIQNKSDRQYPKDLLLIWVGDNTPPKGWVIRDIHIPQPADYIISEELSKE